MVASFSLSSGSAVVAQVRELVLGPVSLVVRLETRGAETPEALDEPDERMSPWSLTTWSIS